jgi:hypothetical protein
MLETKAYSNCFSNDADDIATESRLWKGFGYYLQSSKNLPSGPLVRSPKHIKSSFHPSVASRDLHA